MSISVSKLQERPPALYYLQNFKSALCWLLERYRDLLSDAEHAFIEEFTALPWSSQALLVRLIMRRARHFRATKIRYPEIDSVERAVGPLVGLQWIDPRPLLEVADLFRLARRAEIAEIFPEAPRSMSKCDLLELLKDSHPEARCFEEWRGSVAERVYFVAIAPICTQLRLLFFGNFRQDWSEFVLADLGIFKYETVGFSTDSRAFQSRKDIEDFFALYECRRRLYEESPLTAVLEHIPKMRLDHEWLESRRDKLIFQIAREFERSGEREKALSLYSRCSHPGARLRAVRTLETSGRPADAYHMAVEAAAQPESAAEAQRLARIVARLERRLKLARSERSRPARPERLDLIVPAPAAGCSVEQAALEHLAGVAAPVYYVENALINSLFGLLCWDAIFAPVSGAFFHPFHVGPADLFSATYQARRSRQFDECLARLHSDEYRISILDRYRTKQGTQSPFVYWGLLDEGLLNTALACIPAAHLRAYFGRLLSNLRENRSGLPDLVQFWPAEARYRMIEVKGPGDRLQDNQQRWMQFCLERAIPVTVCHVRWV